MTVQGLVWKPFAIHPVPTAAGVTTITSTEKATAFIVSLSIANMRQTSLYRTRGRPITPEGFRDKLDPNMSATASATAP
jgi:hypothetical protein